MIVPWWIPPSLIIGGIALVIDAVGSILYFWTQPFWPNHAERIARGCFAAFLVAVGVILL